MKTRERSRVESKQKEFPTLDAVKDHFVERGREAEDLYRGIGTGCPVVVTGAPASGKSAVVSAVVNVLGRREVVADCVRAGSEKALYGAILSELRLRAPGSMLPSAAEFVHILSGTRESIVLVIDRAERLRKERFPPRTLAVLLRIKELAAPARVSTVLITEVRWERFFASDPTLPLTLTLPFLAYKRDQMLDILVRDGPQEEEYSSLCSLVFDVMFGACRDLRELKRVCENLYPKYVEPLRSGTIERGNAGKLYNHLHGHLKQAIQSLYRRTRSREDGERKAVTRATSTTPCQSVNEKVLILSCYLAGKNPPRTDSRYFTSLRQQRKKRRKLSSSASRTTDDETSSTRIIPLERILAIFRVLSAQCDAEDTHSDGRVEDPVTTSLFIQLTTLVSNGYLSRFGDSLTDPRFRCLVNDTTAELTAKDVGLQLHNFLHVADENM